MRDLRLADFDGAFACARQAGMETEDFDRHADICVLDGHRVRFAVANPHRSGLTLAALRLVEKVDAAVLRHLDRGRAASAHPAYAGAHDVALVA